MTILKVMTMSNKRYYNKDWWEIAEEEDRRYEKMRREGVVRQDPGPDISLDEIIEELEDDEEGEDDE